MIPSASYLYKSAGDIGSMVFGSKQLSTVMRDFGITRPLAGYASIY